MNRRDRRDREKFNRLQKKRKPPEPKKDIAIKARHDEKAFRQMLSNIMSDIYTQLEKSVKIQVTSSLDRKALMEDIDKIFGKKEVKSKIIK